MIPSDEAIAVHRFGLGPKPGELDMVASARPKAWLLDQLEGARPEPQQFAGFMTSNELWDNFIYRYTRYIPIKGEQAAAEKAGDKKRYDQLAEDYNRILYGWVTWVKEGYILECGARTNFALTTDEPFRERLVHFWSNHLVVPNGKQQSSVLLGSYEREVIRPRVTGKFADMLMASIKHQVMLAFLDNNVSVGPNSAFGKASGNGLNENLAREILELHTLGVEGGYSRDDVIELAKGITGWSMWPLGLDPDRQRILAADPTLTRGSFYFYEDWHEPGPRTLLGKTYSQTGIAQGEAMLNDLARHPNTAKFLATKLARHFVADDPPADLVKRLADVYLQSDTDLGEMTRALVEAKEPWQTFGSKMKQPIDYVYSVMRTLGMTLADNDIPPQTRYVYETDPEKEGLWVWFYSDSFGLIEDRKAVLDSIKSKKQTAGFETLNMMRDLAAMGQPLQIAPGPQGWYDRWSDWNGADSLMKRIERSLMLASKEAGRVTDPRQFVTASLGNAASTELVTAVSRAATPEQGLGLVLASPEFQRR